MLKMTNTIVGKEYITPRDALLSMISTHVLEKDTCYDPEPDAVTEILAHAVSYHIIKANITYIQVIYLMYNASEYTLCKIWLKVLNDSFSL